MDGCVASVACKVEVVGTVREPSLVAVDPVGLIRSNSDCALFEEQPITHSNATVSRTINALGRIDLTGSNLALGPMNLWLHYFINGIASCLGLVTHWAPPSDTCSMVRWSHIRFG